MSAIPHLVDTASVPHLSERARSTIRPVVRALTLWHLLSLDAPTVAALWTWFIAAVTHIRLSAIAVVAMFLAVWLLYAADRLLDSRSLEVPTRHSELEPRHYFHRR